MMPTVLNNFQRQCINLTDRNEIICPFYINGTVLECVQNCSTSMILVNDVCVKDCPDDEPYINSTMCVNQCDSLLF